MVRGESAPLSTWLLLHQTYGLIYKHLDHCAAAAGYTAAVMVPLLVLKETGRSLPLSQFARLLVQEAQSITTLVDRLEARGLVRREADKRDRRVINVALTAEGEAAADALMIPLQEALTESFAPLAPPEIETLSERLRLLRAHGAEVLNWGRGLFRDGSASSNAD